MEFHKITMEEIISTLPEIKKIDKAQDFLDIEMDLFIQAVGFEERTTAVSRMLSEINNYKIKETILIKYLVNIEDNLYYEKDILHNLQVCGSRISIIQLDDNFSIAIKQKIESLITKDKVLKVAVDYSTFSSKLILSLTKILLSFNIDFTLFYAEGEIYHPTNEEIEKIISSDEQDNNFEQSYGVHNVIISPEFLGSTKENQDLVICFPSFKAERSEVIISHIDDLIIKQDDKKRLIWVLGDPHILQGQDKLKRKKFQERANRLSSNDTIYFVCTLDYKKTLTILDHIYKDVFSDFHINISDLGSKMQSFAIALFAILRRDITVYYSEPHKYNPSHYSEGVEDIWQIKIGNSSDFLNLLYKVDLIKSI